MSYLQVNSPADITTDMILKASGVSRGSLYHHFEDLSDLLETALVRSFSAVVDENISVLSDLMGKANNASDYYQVVIDFNDFAQATERRDFRLNRVRLLGLAVSNPRMAEKLAVEQSRLTNAFAELFKIAQARGWIRADLDAHAISVFIQAFTIGRVVDDISQQSMDSEAWKSLILKIAANVLGMTAP